MNTKTPTVLTNLQRGNVKQENLISEYERTIFELAAQGELHDIEPQAVDTVDSNNMTALIWAAGYGQISTVEYLLKSGANPDHKANGGKSALMFAASKGFFHVVKTLINDGANLDETDDQGNSALMYATHQDQTLVIRELIKNGADLSIMNVYNQSAYSISLTKNHRSAQMIIEARLLQILKENCSNLVPEQPRSKNRCNRQHA